MSVAFFYGQYRVFFDGVWYNVVDNDGAVVDGFTELCDAVSYVYFLDSQEEDWIECPR